MIIYLFKMKFETQRNIC